MNNPKPQIYLISPPKINDLLKFIEIIDGFEEGMIACFQLRLKGLENREIVKIGKEIFPILQAKGIACIVNDNPNIAKDTKADGVHLGQSDGDIKEARQLLGKDAIIGSTCHNSRHLAMQAAEQGADYVAFGAFYPTQTKEVQFQADCEILTWWHEIMEIPCVAIGGINKDNILPIINASADFIALSSGIWEHNESPIKALYEIQTIINQAN